MLSPHSGAHPGAHPGAGAGRVILAGTPLGNVGDASARLREALASAPVIAAEDTRRVQRLCRELGVVPTGRILSFFDGNEAGRVPQLLDALRAGQDVLVVTDAGMPSVSDPGYRLVCAAVEAGIGISALPGPSAVTTALALSGLPPDRFCFEGFLPHKAGERARALGQLAGEQRTLIFFEAPHRLPEALAALASALGDQRRAAVCRELTKSYEQVLRGTLAELAAWAQDTPGQVRGEITLVVAGAEAGASARAAAPAELAAAVAALEAGGQPRKAAIAQVAQRQGLPKRVVYDAVVQHRGTPPA